MNKYEATFIFPESLKEEALEAVQARVLEEITRLGGRVENITRLGKRAFARPLHKKKAGYYVIVSFSLEPNQVAPLQARYRLNEEVFRVQIVRAEGRTGGRVTVPPESATEGEDNGQS